MNKYSSIFSLLISVFPRLDFERLVRQTGAAGAAESFENPGRSEARNVARVLGEVEAQPDVTLGA